MTVRRYQWHRCQQRHLSGRKFADCAFEEWYAPRGSGQWVVVSECLIPSVTLFLSKAAAADELARIDAERCAAGCSLRHHLGFIDLRNGQSDLVGARPIEVA